jgi:hypothetical protein
MGVIQGRVGYSAPVSVYGVINACLIKERALPSDMLWSTKGSAAWACECFWRVRRAKPLCVGARECVVNR